MPRLPTIALTLALVAGGSACAAEDRRRYSDGPLTADDFRGEIMDIPGIAAKTVTQFLFDYRYKYRTTARGTTATLDSITIHAYIRRDRSWNRNPEDERLLDHEQGHADIAQVHCLRARLAFRKRLVKGPPVNATADSLIEATDALDREVKREMANFEHAAREADAEYDRETRNGLGGQQAEWRRVQGETLRQLESEWRKKK